jgi:hypothetical protein
MLLFVSASDIAKVTEAPGFKIQHGTQRENSNFVVVVALTRSYIRVTQLFFASPIRKSYLRD